METDAEWAQMLDLSDNYLKETITNMFQELKEGLPWRCG